MPIATPQGTLDFKSVDKVTFVGASSNTVIDTTTGSLGVGVGVGGPTSNLHVVGNTRLEGDINMLHTSNTASIKLNSNVVAEFPRSKKLIKYPRVAMTANSSGGYVASANSEYPDGTNYHAFRVFNNRGINVPYVAGVGWESANTPTFGDDGLWGGSNASGAPTSSSANTTMTLENGNTIYGEWLQIQLPTKIRLEYVNFLILSGSAHAMAHRAPRAGYVLGSNNGTNWTTLKNWSGIVYDTWTAYYDKFYKFDIDKEVDNYQYFRFVWTETASGSGNSLSRYASCQELEFWGVPEYDPEAHGTDVTVKSYPNVPNTDWLEVYYDAKGLPNGAVTNPMSGLGGTTINGTATNVTVSDGAFVFDGTSDIRSTVSTFTGDQPHTMSVWVNISTSHTLGDGYICVLAPSTGENLNQVSTIRYQNDGFNLQSWGNDIQMYNIGVEKGRWYHLVAVYDGGGVTTSSKRLYIDTVRNTRISGNTTTGDEIDFANTTLSLGSRVDGTSSHLTGSIANFRLFNRALTSGEIYQLYAYQKEYFGHGDLSMTLKAGRLGIGTSEPRAALDVRGDIIGGCPVYFQARLTSEFTAGLYNNSINGAVIPWDQLYENTGCYNTTTGLFTAPMTAVYKFGYGMRPASSSTTYWTYIQKNGVAAKSANDHPGRIYSHTDLDTQSATFIMDLRMGDTVGILLASSGSPMPKVSNSYGYFHGHYFGESRGQHDFWD